MTVSDVTLTAAILTLWGCLLVWGSIALLKLRRELDEKNNFTK